MEQNNMKMELLALKTINEAISDLICEETEVETLNEGYNLDMRREIKACKKAFKIACSKCKSAIKDGDKKKALSHIAEMKKAVAVCQQNIKQAGKDYTEGELTGSAIISLWTGAFADIGYMMKCFLIALIPVAGFFGALILAIKKSISNVQVNIEDIKNNDGSRKDAVNEMNSYRKNALSLLKDLEAKIGTLETKVKSMGE